ncbi:hypothetical protein LCGC14_0698670 [marine sediment metagenome]|uniref:Uncharacterized protein n=1 Tax=marine sediment metagenome TaxID=412755 RepID=A0A0F9TRB2_9ZZZZ
MTLQLVLTVTYDEATVSDRKMLKENLAGAVEHAVENGMLTGYSEVVVDTYKYEIHSLD